MRRRPTVLEALYGLIAAEVVKWLVLDESAPLHEQAIAMNVGTFASTTHRVTRRPQCPACGDEALHRPDRPPVPLSLAASPKTHRNSGGARTVAPEVTLAKYRHLVSPVSGVVTWLTRTTDATDPWLHVYWAGSNLGMRSRSLSSLRRSLRSKSAGKGSTREQSEVSALCEAVERYSGALHGEEIRVRKRFAELARGDEAIHPNAVQLFSDHQLDNAKSINAKGHPYNVVPPRLDPDAAIDWTPVWSMTQGRHRYLPTSMLYSMAAEQRGPADLIADSNGCAAGNTLEEAILQGFYELVERDAFGIWWYNRLRVPAVDLTSFDDDFLASAADYYRRCERDLWMLDVTSDIGVPTFVALSRRPDAKTEDIIYGAGAHADPRIAALRAICELNQCLTWLPRPGQGDGRPMIDDPMALWWWKTARLADCTWLAPVAGKPLRKASQYPVLESTDTRDDVERGRALVEARGMELLVLDQDAARHRHAGGAGRRAGHASLLGAVRARAAVRRARQPGSTGAPARGNRIESRAPDRVRRQHGYRPGSHADPGPSRRGGRHHGRSAGALSQQDFAGPCWRPGMGAHTRVRREAPHHDGRPSVRLRAAAA